VVATMRQRLNERWERRQWRAAQLQRLLSLSLGALIFADPEAMVTALGLAYPLTTPTDPCPKPFLSSRQSSFAIGHADSLAVIGHPVTGRTTERATAKVAAMVAMTEIAMGMVTTT
jgi:hypothetical protein